MLLHLVEEDAPATLCGQNMVDVIDCITVEYYVEHYHNGTEEEMFALARSAAVLLRVVLAFLDKDMPTTELSDEDSIMCEECCGFAGLDILAHIARGEDELDR